MDQVCELALFTFCHILLEKLFSRESGIERHYNLYFQSAFMLTCRQKSQNTKHIVYDQVSHKMR